MILQNNAGKEEIKMTTKMKLERLAQSRISKYQNIENKSINETVDDRIIFYRYLGHLEIKNSHIWKINDK
jgi:hypothetical protein